jgi:hypothetical protein
MLFHNTELVQILRNLLRSRLRHYITSQKVADSIPNEFAWFFIWHPSSRNKILGSNQFPTEWVSGIFLGVMGWLTRKANNLTATCRLPRKFRNIDVSQPCWPQRPVGRIMLLLPYSIVFVIQVMVATAGWNSEPNTKFISVFNTSAKFSILISFLCLLWSVTLSLRLEDWKNGR